MTMAWFNYGYSSSNLVPYERRSFVTDRGYVPNSGTFVPRSIISPIVATEEFDYPDRERPQQERDMTDWLNPYQEREIGSPPEYPFHEFNYGP